MVEQVTAARDSLTPERQHQHGGTRSLPDRVNELARLGARGDSRAIMGALQGILAGAPAGGPVTETNEVRLRVEEDVDWVVAEVVDRDSGEVVREIPPEEMVEAAKKLEAMLGRVLDKQV
jgi:flagellar protein FlaG